MGDAGATGAAYFGLDFSVGYAFNNIVDDTTPPVVTASQSFSYVENQAANAQVATVGATDAIGVTKFRFSPSGATTSADGYYTIDNTGVVRLTSAGTAAGVAQNDYDISPNSFTYVVQAGDAAGNWSSPVSITLDVTAAAPKITGPSGGAGGAASAISVNENQTVVTTLTADRAVTWSLSGGADASKFAINAATGAVTFVAAPDYEAPTDADANNAYVLVITATDGGGLTSTQTITVTVLDVADNGPVITGPDGIAGATSSAISINENKTAVTTLTSSVPATWTISGGVDAAKFTIDSATGALSFVAAPDYEVPTDTDTDNIYVVEVTATGSNSLATAQTVAVTVLNVAEASPVITGPSGAAGAASSAISVNENQTTVATLTANRTVAWTISGGADAAKLAINATTGVITFVAAPDFEAPTDADTNNVYLIEVTATDANNETAVQTVAVTVLDVVDTPPIVTMPGGGAVGDSVVIKMLEGRVEIATFASSRPVTWKISGGADSARFHIGATGALAFVSAPNYAAPTDADGDNTYIVEVTATDGVGLTAVHTLMVTIENNDHAAPLITGPDGVAGAESSVMDLVEGVTQVTTFQTNETVMWSLVGGTDQALFIIDGGTGELRFVNPKSFETPEDSDRNNTYVVLVRATDAVSNSSDHRLTVRITDVDEVAPRIAAIAKELRSDLRTYAFNSLGDMLAFNEGLFRDTSDCMASAGQGAIRPGMQLNEFNQGASLDWARTHCTARYRVIANAGAAIDHADGDWTRRGLASVRVETEVKQDVTLGVGLMGSFANNDLPAFADSSISDHTLQINGYLKANLAENLRAGAFVGLGRAWYDFDLHRVGFDLSGKMEGHRQVYGAMLSGDIEVGEVLVTMDVILSRAAEELGQADLTGTVGDETRKVLFDIGDVDTTRLSIPVSGEFILWGGDPKGWKSTLRLSPGLLCEDTSADTSSLTCGYQFGGRLIAKRDGSGGGYLDYRLESVDRRTRNMIGIGYEYIFGARRNLEWALDVTGGVVDNRPDSRAMITFRAR